MDSFSVGDWQATGIPVLDIHELAEGKLAALLARTQARDLFDSHAILQMKNLDKDRLRISPTMKQSTVADYGTRLAAECRQALSVVLPFSEAERAFLDLLLDQGEIDPTILTSDPILQERILEQPLLEWKTLNFRKHKGLI